MGRGSLIGVSTLVMLEIMVRMQQGVFSPLTLLDLVTCAATSTAFILSDGIDRIERAILVGRLSDATRSTNRAA